MFFDMGLTLGQQCQQRAFALGVATGTGAFGSPVPSAFVAGSFVSIPIKTRARRATVAVPFRMSRPNVEEKVSPSIDSEQMSFEDAAKVFISHLQRAWLEGDGRSVYYVTDKANRAALIAAAKYLLINDDKFRYVFCEFYEQGAGPPTETVAVHLHNSVLAIP